MQLNIVNFEDILRKSTLNYLISSTQLKVSGDRIKSKMKMPDNTAVIILDLPNDSMSGLNDEVELNFDTPNQNVKPYLELIDEDTVVCDITDEKMTLKVGRQKTNIFFCAESFVSSFGGNEPQIPTFTELDIDEEMLNIFGKLKKVAARFKKIYFSVKDNKFFVEATDKLNRFSNGVKFQIGTVESEKLEMVFDFKNFNSVLSIIGEEPNQFKASFAWLADQEAGIILFEKTDGSEKYYLMSRVDEG